MKKKIRVRYHKVQISYTIYGDYKAFPLSECRENLEKWLSRTKRPRSCVQCNYKWGSLKGYFLGR